MSIDLHSMCAHIEISEHIPRNCRRVTRSGIGCILVEQHVDMVLDFADDVLILERGRPVFWKQRMNLGKIPRCFNQVIGFEKTPRQGMDCFWAVG
ncbi:MULTISPECIES: hypothetical protein [unclassified Bradyrhizobium]|uniref:hypothetical protein n=1 Tax=unclassified Bradyrhizobium TaxID=2631580 RepID=UPI001FF938EE|nr:MULTISPECIES: hypothetical protein [unclassified Bradyrhizobium]